MSDNNSIDRTLKHIQGKLASCGIEDSLLEASLLVEAFSGFDRMEQLRRPQDKLTGQQIKDIAAAVEERCRRKPMSQILGETWFYGRPFYVNANVLTPRPDTEILVEAVVKEIRQRQADLKREVKLLDTCTGSGCIGISICLELKEASLICKLDLVDTSADALKVARRNAERHYLPESLLSFHLRDLWPKGDMRYDVITCNPPYINQKDMSMLMPEVAHYEPKSALYGGRDGLDFYRRLAEEASSYLTADGILAVEHAYDQRQTIKEIFAASALEFLNEVDDYGGNARVLIFVKTG